MTTTEPTSCARRCGAATPSRPRRRAKGSQAELRQRLAAATTTATPTFGEALYDAEQRGELPEAAALASLGCGNPTAVADLREGETVLDLGSGGGIDVLLSARRVGPTGLAYGLDMTDEMLALARGTPRRPASGTSIFLKGVIEDDPAAGRLGRRRHLELRRSTSRTDKPAVLAEIARVLKPGGRIGITRRRRRGPPDVPSERAERGCFVGCIAGALSQGEYETGLEAAGFEDVSVDVHARGRRRDARRDRQGAQADRRRADRAAGQRSGAGLLLRPRRYW